jgi:xanthine dehydrogenase accessory factor
MDVTRGHLHDQAALARVLKTDAAYIGMIGSRSKRDTVYASLLKQGFCKEDLKRVHCPIGLDIGAETPAEIAVSITAELIRERARIG